MNMYKFIDFCIAKDTFKYPCTLDMFEVNKMDTQKEAEEMKIEIENRLGFIRRFLSIEIEQDDICDGERFYIRIE